MSELYIACKTCDQKKIIQLIDNDYDINNLSQNEFGSMSLLIYATICELKLVFNRILLLKNYNINATDWYSMSALHYIKDVNTIKKLVDAGLKINDCGDNIIMFNLYAQNIEIIIELIKLGADYKIVIDEIHKYCSIHLISELHIEQHHRKTEKIYNAIVNKCIETKDIITLDESINNKSFYNIICKYTKQIHELYYPLLYEILCNSLMEKYLFDMIFIYIV